MDEGTFWMWTSCIVAKDGSIKLAVSCLKIKPKVLIFPCKSSRVSATFTHATIGSLSPFFRKWMRVRVGW